MQNLWQRVPRWIYRADRAPLAAWLSCLFLCVAPLGLSAVEPLPKIVAASEIGTSAVRFHTLRPGQSLELIGFDSIAVSQIKPRVTVREFAPGHHQLKLPDQADHLAIDYRAGTVQGRMHLFPWVPIKATTAQIGHFALGAYPPVADRGEHYAPPIGMIKVTERNQQQPVSAHFRLGQFLCKQESGWPKYLALKTPLLTKLEQIIVRLQARGITAETLQVMSGYRTPRYNRGLGNVAYSRHVYGDAADVFVDVDGDGRMDDLNGDGKSDVGDAQWLLALAEDLEADGARPGQAVVAGGLSAYPATAYHGPFLHVDTRGTSARWGYGR